MTDTTSGTYVPLTEEPSFDMDEDEGEYSRGPFLFLVALIVLAAFGFVVYVAYQQGLRQGQMSSPPLILAEPGPVKVVPAEPGGKEEPYQDKFVLNGETPMDEARVLPPPEEPIVRPLPEPAKVTPPPVEVAKVEPVKEPAKIAEKPEIVAPVDATPAEKVKETEPLGAIDVAEASKVEAPARTTELLKVPEPPVIPEAAKETTRVSETVTPAPSTLRPAADTEVAKAPAATDSATGSIKQPAAASAAIDATAGNYVVQIASVKDDEARANRLAASVGDKHSDVLSQLGFDIQRADLGEKGIYYRVRIGPFQEKAEASQTCSALKGQGQDCYVTKR